jgi:hypothetical protein
MADSSRDTRYLLAALMLPLQILSVGKVSAHTDSPGSPPLAPTTLRLQHRKPAEIIALFARERLPGTGGAPIPRAARIDTEESLVPGGVDAVLRAEDPHQIILVGTEGVPAIRRCIQVLDAPTERTGPDREKIVLTLRRPDARRLRTQVLRLPEAGTAVPRGRQLVLEGSRAWLHRALRQVIRAELQQPASAGLRMP